MDHASVRRLIAACGFYEAGCHDASARRLHCFHDTSRSLARWRGTMAIHRHGISLWWWHAWQRLTGIAENRLSRPDVVIVRIFLLHALKVFEEHSINFVSDRKDVPARFFRGHDALLQVIDDRQRVLEEACVTSTLNLLLSGCCVGICRI